MNVKEIQCVHFEKQYTTSVLYIRAHVVVSEYSSVSQNDRCDWIPQAEHFPSNSDVPFSSDFGDLEAKVHGVEVGGFPLEDVVAPPGLVSLRRNPNHQQNYNMEDILG